MTVGLVIAAGGMVYSGTASRRQRLLRPACFPGLVIVGVGLGLMFSAAINASTAGVLPSDAGVASAMVNIGQQVGGSIGTALLSTLAADAASSYLHSHRPIPRGGGAG